MRPGSRSFRFVSIPAIVVLALGGGIEAIRADVTLVEKTVFEGIGERQWFASEGDNTTIVSGDKLRQESNSKPTGALLKRFDKEGFRTATITRLDRKLMYMVDYKSESYQEFPFSSYEAMQEEMKKSMEQAKEPGASGEETKPTFECDPVKLAANRPGGKSTVAGFDAQQVVITGDQTCRDLETKATCRIVYTYDLWTTQATNEMKELQDFYRKQAEAMGISMDSSQMKAIAGAAQALASANTEGLEAVLKELSKVEGHPVKTHIRIETGGDCASSGGQGEESSGSGMKDVGSALKGLFKKKDKPEEAGKKPAATAPGMTKVFGMSTELISVAKTGAPADSFDPPAGFKKTETQMPSAR